MCQDQICTGNGNVGVKYKYTSYKHLVDAMVASGKCHRGMARSAGGLLGGMNSQVVAIHTVCIVVIAVYCSAVAVSATRDGYIRHSCHTPVVYCDISVMSWVCVLVAAGN